MAGFGTTAGILLGGGALVAYGAANKSGAKYPLLWAAAGPVALVAVFRLAAMPGRAKLKAADRARFADPAYREKICKQTIDDTGMTLTKCMDMWKRYSEGEDIRP